ncbi:MAG: hypothetical protein IKG18_14140 [Atopobiaceae bacterium]|nr:hypothetical protein [Atopobiaceae bacterium]
MDEEYARNVEEVMGYLAAKGRSRRAVRGHGECYSMLASYLRENKLPYSEVKAWEWLEDIASKLCRTRRSIWIRALCKIADLYATGEIVQLHYRDPRRRIGCTSETSGSWRTTAATSKAPALRRRRSKITAPRSCDSC